MESFYVDRPLNFAHRGASHKAPENTLAAFLLAVELGADGIELDVQLSRDGEAVVIHDLNLETTTDGHGLVRNSTLAELKKLNAGSWYDPAFSDQRIPTLQEVIDAAGHHLLLNIELKTSSLRDDGLAATVVRIIEENHLQDRVVVSSFNPLAVRRVKRLNPSIPVGLLYAPDMPFFLRRPWSRHLLQPEALHPHLSIIDEKYMRWAREHGYRVHTWTVDEPDEMGQLMRLGVDLIITNRSDLLNQMLVSKPGGQAPSDSEKPSVPYPTGS
ncbi:MAG TPA: glycerophosphodiester phosphodiesterase [Anaerolineae bacterium]|nr:glycerophosphodiester phosphodiesterase [Anaerolineae bacterium]